MKTPFLYRALARLNVVAVLLLLLGAEALLLPALLRPVPEPEPVMPEVARVHLTLRDGRLYRAGETQPYNGLMVEYYPGRVLQSRSMVSWGRMHGVSEGWQTNGVLQVREYFNRGVSHGVRTKWDAQGRKVSEGTLVAGQFQGLFRRWHENGRLAEEVPMKDNQPDGLSRAWFPSGCLKAEVRLKNGQVLEQKFFADGERKAMSAQVAQVR